MPVESLIYHNPRCRKSREALAFLKSKGISPIEVRYLDKTPNREAIKLMLARLHLPVTAIIRKEENLFKEKYKTLQLTEEEWLDVLLEHPILIQRPLVSLGNRAVIGRDTESLNLLFKK